MKLRIHRNSIRLRLSPSDVVRFDEAGWVESGLDIAGERLTYRLVADRGAAAPTAEFKANMIIVRLPQQAAVAWSRSEAVGIEGGDGLRIVVEKDLECRHERGEGDIGSYPDPEVNIAA